MFQDRGAWLACVADRHDSLCASVKEGFKPLELSLDRNFHGLMQVVFDEP